MSSLGYTWHDRLNSPNDSVDDIICLIYNHLLLHILLFTVSTNPGKLSAAEYRPVVGNLGISSVRRMFGPNIYFLKRNWRSAGDYQLHHRHTAKWNNFYSISSLLEQCRNKEKGVLKHIDTVSD